MSENKIKQTLSLLLLVALASWCLGSAVFAQELIDKEKTKTQEERLQEYRAEMIKNPENAYTVYVQGRIMPPEKYPGFKEARAIMDELVFDPMGNFAASKKWIWEEYHGFSRKNGNSNGMVSAQNNRNRSERNTYGYILYMLNNRPPLKILFEKETGALFCYIDIPKDSELLFLYTVEVLDELAKHMEIEVIEKTGYWEKRDPDILKKYFTPPNTAETPPVNPPTKKRTNTYWTLLILVFILAIMLIIVIYNMINRHHNTAEHTLGPIPVLPPERKSNRLQIKEQNPDKDNQQQSDKKPDQESKPVEPSGEEKPRYTKNMPDKRYNKDYEDTQ